MTSTTSLGYDGKRVVVAGGGGDGMGAAAASLLVELGAEVIVLDLREPTVEGVTFHRTDLGDATEIEHAVERVGAPVGALFNCQGVSGTAPGMSSRTVMAVNLLGLRHLTELVLPLIPDGGAVVSISSAGGLGWERRAAEILSLLAARGMDEGLAWCDAHDEALLPQPFPNAYAFSKQTLILWTLQLATTSITNGVRVNVTSPGSTSTVMARDFPDEGVDMMNHPSGRSSTPVEQAWPLVYLNSPLASYVNGVNVPVDGGNFAARTVKRLCK